MGSGGGRGSRKIKPSTSFAGLHSFISSVHTKASVERAPVANISLNSSSVTGPCCCPSLAKNQERIAISFHRVSSACDTLIRLVVPRSDEGPFQMISHVHYYENGIVFEKRTCEIEGYRHSFRNPKDPARLLQNRRGRERLSHIGVRIGDVSFGNPSTSTFTQIMLDLLHAFVGESKHGVARFSIRCRGDTSRGDI